MSNQKRQKKVVVSPVPPMVHATPASSPTSTTATTSRARLPLVIGHRGGSDEGPENTLGVFRQALERGADGVELDLQLTRDGKLVVLHDDTLERTAAPFSDDVQADGAADKATERSKYRELITTHVNELTLEQVQSVDIGSFYDINRQQGSSSSSNNHNNNNRIEKVAGEVGRNKARIGSLSRWSSERVATFESALALLQEFPAAKMYAELKSGDFRSAAAAAEIVRKLKPHKDQLWFIGFNLKVMIHTKSLLPEYKVMHVLRTPTDMKQRLETASGAVLDHESLMKRYKDEFMRSARLFDGVDPCANVAAVDAELVRKVKQLWQHDGAPAEHEQANANGDPVDFPKSEKVVACWVSKKIPGTDSKENWARLAAAGVDAITTDNPLECQRFLETLRAEKPPEHELRDAFLPRQKRQQPRRHEVSSGFPFAATDLPPPVECQ